MDIDVDMDMDLDVDIMVREATLTDARRSDSVCRTPPMNVAMRTCDGVTTALLDSGAVTVKAQDCDGKTALMLVVCRGRLECNVVAGDDGDASAAH